MTKKRWFRLVGAVLLATVVLTGCGQNRVDEAHIGIAYTQGPFEGEKFDKVIEPGGTHFTFDDIVYKLPARQVSYIAASTQNGEGQETLNDGADGPSIIITDKNGVQLRIDMTVRFFINSRDEVMETFFTDICQKTDCWEGVDDPDGGTSDGWGKMLRDYFGDPAKTVSTQIGLNYAAADVRYNNEVMRQFASDFADTFVDVQERAVGRGDYFCGNGFDRNEDNCPTVNVEINRVRYMNPELEGIKEREQLANDRERLAVEEQQAAAAEQLVNQTRATPEYIALTQAEAMKKCAENPAGCSLNIVISDGTSVGTSIPLG